MNVADQALLAMVRQNSLDKNIYHEMTVKEGVYYIKLIGNSDALTDVFDSYRVWADTYGRTLHLDIKIKG